MLRLHPSSLLALALCLSTAPAFADDAPPLPPLEALPPAALPPPSGVPYPELPPYEYWHPPPSSEVVTVRRSTGAMALGIIFTVTGSIGLATGTGIYEGSRCDEVFSRDNGQIGIIDSCSDKTGEIAGMALLIGSGLIVGGGVALWVYGGQHVERTERTLYSAALPKLHVGPRSAALRWSF